MKRGLQLVILFFAVSVIGMLDIVKSKFWLHVSPCAALSFKYNLSTFIPPVIGIESY